MLTFTLKEALDQEHDTMDHYLYLYRDGETIFYIGQATFPLERMLGHLGKDRFRNPSMLGCLITDHRPASDEWVITLYSYDDCIPFVQEQEDIISQAYRRRLEELRPHVHFCDEALSDIAEDALIAHFRPCLNTVHAQNSKELPEQYSRGNGDGAGRYL